MHSPLNRCDLSRTASCQVHKVAFVVQQKKSLKVSASCIIRLKLDTHITHCVHLLIVHTFIKVIQCISFVRQHFKNLNVWKLSIFDISGKSSH